VKPLIDPKRFDRAAATADAVLQAMIDSGVQPDSLATMIASCTIAFSDDAQRLSREQWIQAAAFIYDATVHGLAIAEGATKC
jgi:hypothetical protein